MPVGSPPNPNATSPLYATSPPSMPPAFSPSSLGDRNRSGSTVFPQTGKALTPFPLHETAVKILLLENVNTAAVDMLTAQGFEVKEIKSALGEDELIRTLKDGNFQAVGIRSKTKITARVISEVPGVSLPAPAGKEHSPLFRTLPRRGSWGKAAGMRRQLRLTTASLLCSSL